MRLHIESIVGCIVIVSIFAIHRASELSRKTTSLAMLGLTEHPIKIDIHSTGRSMVRYLPTSMMEPSDAIHPGNDNVRNFGCCLEPDGSR